MRTSGPSQIIVSITAMCTCLWTNAYWYVSQSALHGIPVVLFCYFLSLLSTCLGDWQASSLTFSFPVVLLSKNPQLCRSGKIHKYMVTAHRWHPWRNWFLVRNNWRPPSLLGCCGCTTECHHDIVAWVDSVYSRGSAGCSIKCFISLCTVHILS